MHEPYQSSYVNRFAASCIPHSPHFNIRRISPVLLNTHDSVILWAYGRGAARKPCIGHVPGPQVRIAAAHLRHRSPGARFHSAHRRLFPAPAGESIVRSAFEQGEESALIAWDRSTLLQSKPVHLQQPIASTGNAFTHSRARANACPGELPEGACAALARSPHMQQTEMQNTWAVHTGYKGHAWR